MSIPRSPSVPTTMGNSVSSLPMRSTADGSLMLCSCSSWSAGQRTRSARAAPSRSAALAYGVAVAVAERDLTTQSPGVSALLPWSGVVAPWLLSRVVSIVVLLAAVERPGARVALRAGGDPVGRRLLPRHRPQRLRAGRRALPEVAVLPAAPRPHPRARARSPTTRSRSSWSTSSLFLVALAGVYRLASPPRRRHGRRASRCGRWRCSRRRSCSR